MKKRNSFRQWLISETAHLCESYRNASLEKRKDIISFFDEYIPTCEGSVQRVLTAIKEGLLAIK